MSEHATAPRLLLVDASIYLFRGYFSLPEAWRDNAGVPTNAVLGFARALIVGLQTHAPTHVSVAFDASLNTCFRNDLYPLYKANRPQPDAAIIKQMAHCQRLVQLLGLHGCADERFEADDLIASLLTMWRDHSRPGDSARAVWLMTRDKDYGQLLNDEHTQVWDTAGEPALDRGAFIAKYRVDPESFPDYQALVGDKVDNIPGVPGVGATTAAHLLRRYKTLEEIYVHLHEIGAGGAGVRRHQRVAEDLLIAREHVFAMRELTRLRRDIAPLHAPAQLRPGARDEAGLQAWLTATGLAKSLRLPAFMHD